MSLDLEISYPECTHCGRGGPSNSFNYTYNVSPMWYKMFPKANGMVDIDYMTGKQAAKRLNKAISRMQKNEESMRLLEPDNGWGSYTGFLQFLKQLLTASEKCPDGIWRADR